MSYPLLLLIISLVVIVPTVFVARGKPKQKLLGNKNQNQQYLGHNASVSSNQIKASAEQLGIADTIQHYRNHPALPISFRQLLGKIYAQYVTLHSVKLAPDQRFTVDKLAGTRLPEVIEDYLTLDKDYAENTIIDSQHELTSQDVTYGQLVSMLDFMTRAQDEGQAQVASNILANRSYLQSVYGEFDQNEAGNNTAAIKAPEHDTVHVLSQPNEASLLERGQGYLTDCDAAAPSKLSLVQHATALGDPLIQQLGELVYSAEQTIRFSDALLSHDSNGNMQAFDHIIATAIPTLLRSSLAQQRQDNTDEMLPLSASQQSLLQQKIERVQQLLNECLNRLQRVAKQQYDTGSTTADTLQTLHNTLKSKHSQAQYLLDSGFFNL